MLLRHAVAKVRKLVFHFVLYLLFISVRMIMEKFFTREEDVFFFTLEAISEVKYFLFSSSSSLVNCTLFLFLHLHSPSASCRMEAASPLAVCVTLSLCAMLPLFWKRWHAHAQLSLHDVSPVCVPSWDSCRELRLSFSLPTLQPHSCWSNLSYLC